jgi:uncharacterized Ntn-hydrolase superfamily protein
MTYSIVARDETTGELGIAVQTCFFGVGSIVPWGPAGVGAVAIPGHGREGLRARGAWMQLEGGADAGEALAQAQGVDRWPSLRQVAVIGTSGTPAVATRADVFDHAGDAVGDSYSAQANMVASPKVWGAMAQGI